MKKIFLLIIGVTLLISCNKTSNNVGQSDEKNKVINLTSSNNKKISELFSSFEIIPLETNDSSLVGLGVRYAEFYKDKIYILNTIGSGRNVLCFDSKGDFLFVVDRVGQGPEEYSNLGEFFIDRSRDEMILICERGKVMSLDLDGNFKKTQMRSDKYNITNASYVNDSTYVGYGGEGLLPGKFDLIQFDSNSLVVKRKSDKIKEPIPYAGDLCLSYYSNNLYYYSFMSDTIYDVTNIEAPEAIYYINPGQNTQNAKKRLIAFSSEYDKFVEEFVKLANSEKMKLIYSYYMNKDWVAINVFEPDERSAKKQKMRESVIFYNNEKRESFSSDNIIFDIFNLNEGLNDVQIIGSSDDSFYLLIENEFTEKQKTQIKQSKLTEKEKAILINYTEEDNPLLIVIKT